MSLIAVHILINPISGSKSKKGLDEKLKQQLDSSRYSTHIHTWNTDDDLESFCQTVLDESGPRIAVAVGGDGTINNLVSRFAGIVPMAILPRGSGNGLARHLGYPADVNAWINWFNSVEKQQYFASDIGRVNGKTFVNVAGIGFDAHIGHVFATLPGRGLRRYAEAVLREYGKSSNHSFEISLDGGKVQGSGFLASVANGSQWGNEFYIARNAVLNDGLFEVVLVKKPSWFQVPSLALALRFRRNHSLISSYQSKEVTILATEATPLHCDGEPEGAATEFHFKLLPGKMTFLIPKN